MLFSPIIIKKMKNILFSDDGSELKQDFEAKVKRQKVMRGANPFPKKLNEREKIKTGREVENKVGSSSGLLNKEENRRSVDLSFSLFI